MKISDLIKIFFALNVIFSSVGIIFFGINGFINLQVAFLSSFFIVVGSFIGYRKNIIKQSENYIIKDQHERDTVDLIDDKFDLYGEINESELTDEDVKNIISEEKKKQNIKDSLANTMKSFGAATSIYRIVGYFLLVFGFFGLKNNQILDPIVYLIGFLIVPIIALVVNFKISKEENFT